MNDQQKNEQSSGARDQEIRAVMNQHWAAPDANDFETDHEDAVPEYQQSGETNPRWTHHTGQTRESAEQKAVFYPANHWRR